MGFNAVYRSLQEVFPQVDLRVLKAVAFEHSKDADAAVEFIISEVLPISSISSRTMESSSVSDIGNDKSTSSSSLSHTPTAIQDAEQRTLEEGQSFSQKHQQPAEESIPASPLKPGSGQSRSWYLDVLPRSSTVPNSRNEIDPEQLCASTGTEVCNSFAKQQETNASTGSFQGSHVESSSLIHEEAISAGCRNHIPQVGIQDLNEQVAYDSYPSAHSDALQDRPCFDNNKMQPESMTAASLPESSDAHKDLIDFSECSKKSLDSSTGEFEKSGPSLDDATEQVLGVESNSSTDVVTRSDRFCGMELLEDAINDAKCNKQTLFLAMEIVINLMKDVEVQEKEAEQAEEEAEGGGLGILAKVEGLKQMLQHAKEANDMHSGEIYGEKAILATEMRELQTRLSSLSDERDKSLKILDEMNQTLSSRLAAAEELKRLAQEKKFEKEESARRALAEQELIMDKVVQESKRLQLEAEENSKLREFLMDRGHVVDTLQGEIAVICHDVKLLKEKFDENVPISKSLYSSQTSCVLASSASSGKCLTSDWTPQEGYSSETSRKTSPASSVHVLPQNSDTFEDDLHPQNSGTFEYDIHRQSSNNFEDKVIVGDDNKDPFDDEWELFEKEN